MSSSSASWWYGALGESPVDQHDAPPIEEDGSGVSQPEGDQLGPRVVDGGSDDGVGNAHQ